MYVVQPGRMRGGRGGLAVSCDECGACNFNKRACECCCSVAKTSRLLVASARTEKVPGRCEAERCGELPRGQASRRWRWKWRWNRVESKCWRETLFATPSPRNNTSRPPQSWSPARTPQTSSREPLLRPNCLLSRSCAYESPTRRMRTRVWV